MENPLPPPVAQDADSGKETKRRAGRLPKSLATKQAAIEVEDEIVRAAQRLEELRKRKRELEQKALNDAVETYVPIIRKLVTHFRMDEKIAADEFERLLMKEMKNNVAG